MNLLSILLLILTLATHKAHGDTAAECPQWAEMGECTLNPNYMSEHCADACRLQADKDRDMTAEIGELFDWGGSCYCCCWFR